MLLIGDSAVQINAQLQVGAVEETVTVTGESPVVDVQQVRRQRRHHAPDDGHAPAGAELRSADPADPRHKKHGDGGRHVQGEPSMAPTRLDALTFTDGMRTTNVMWDIRNGWRLNDAATSELTFETGGSPAEVQVGGLVQNAIPKEGGNTFSGTAFTYYGALSAFRATTARPNSKN